MKLFRRRSTAEVTIFYATDIHGSDICFKKFVNARKYYDADILILGGDMTGKMIVPIVAVGNERYTSNFLGAGVRLESKEEATNFSKKVANMGYYPHYTTQEEIAVFRSDKSALERLFRNKMFQRLKEWINYAQERLKGYRILIAPGNDDPLEIDSVFPDSGVLEVVEGKCIELVSGHWMASSGWSNPTPWDTHREESEEKLERRIRQIINQVPSMERCIFNLHAPPYQTSLDTGPDLKEDLKVRTAMGAPLPKAVGSSAVRKLVEEYQPMLGLFGHIHEARASIRMGRTLCINPGSEYGEGVLRGCLIMLDGSTKVRGFQFTAG
jgi:hypothetical protein